MHCRERTLIGPRESMGNPWTQSGEFLGKQSKGRLWNAWGRVNANDLQLENAHQARQQQEISTIIITGINNNNSNGATGQRLRWAGSITFGNCVPLITVIIAIISPTSPSPALRTLQFVGFCSCVELDFYTFNLCASFVSYF